MPGRLASPLANSIRLAVLYGKDGSYLWKSLCLSLGLLLHARSVCDRHSTLELVDVLPVGWRMGRGIIKDGSQNCNQDLH